MKAQYQKIYEELAEKIRNGSFPAGSRLPTEPVMAKEFGVSVGTLRKAIDRLVLEKKVRREQGRGTFVCGGENAVPFYPSVQKRDFVYGACQYLGDQEQVNQVLFRDEPDCRYMILPSPLDIKPILSSLYNQCSIVQAPLTAFHEMSDFYRPLPEEIFEDFPEPLVKQCRSIDGNLRVFPIILNQTLCYINRKNMDRFGIRMPEDDWTLDELVELCNKFRRADSSVTPFGILPMGALWFDVLLWYYGGDFFDKQGNVWLPEDAFFKMMNFYREMLQRKNGVSIASLPGFSIRELLQKPHVQMCFFGPRGCMDSRPDEMMVHPLPGRIGSAVVFGLGIPCNAPAPERALNFLKKLKDHRLSEIRSAAPAALKDCELWCKRQHVARAELFMQFAEKQHFLSSLPHVYRWFEPVQRIINYYPTGMGLTKDIHRDIFNILCDMTKSGITDSFWT